MKKFFHYTLLIALCTLLFAGCGSGDKPADDAGKVKLGMITRLNASEENFGKFMEQVEATLENGVAIKAN